MKHTNCVVCGAELTGRQRTFCSNRCKQQFKYEKSKGERCELCYKRMRPRLTMGGYIPRHEKCELEALRKRDESLSLHN